MAVATLSVHEPGVTPLLVIFFLAMSPLPGVKDRAKMTFVQKNQKKLLIVNGATNESNFQI